MFSAVHRGHFVLCYFVFYVLYLGCSGVCTGASYWLERPFSEM